MEIGRLQHRIKIATYRESMVPNSTNTNKFFSIIYNVWAKIAVANSKVYFNGVQTDETITHKITIRYQPIITTENWILFDGRFFRIRGVKNIDEKNRWLELACMEIGYDMDSFIVDVNSTGDALGQINL